MDKKIVGMVGAISGLASFDTAQAATATGPNATELLGARSYAELLDPIPNALTLLWEVEAADAAREGRVSATDPNVRLAAHHHHHHHHRYHHHHHHHHLYRHHHHHHRWYQGRYWEYGEGPCWTRTPIGWIWTCR
jgi:hypothetical protein